MVYECLRAVRAFIERNVIALMMKKAAGCNGRDCYLRCTWIAFVGIKKNMQIQSLASACQRIMLTYVFYYKIVIDDITIVTKSNNIIFTLIYQKLLT